MPWQAQLYIGVPVYSHEEARSILADLGADLSGIDLSDTLALCEVSVQRTITHRGKTYAVDVTFEEEGEGGCVLPEKAADADMSDPYTDAAVGFPLTERYAPAVMDDVPNGFESGRWEPFPFNPLEVQAILDRVHEWWPAAQAMIWDRWY